MTKTPLAEWDRWIAERLAAGDRDAMTELYDRFGSYVYALAQRVSRDKHGAEDVTQEVFLALWLRPQNFDPQRGSMRAWLTTITHHTAVGWVRRQVANRRRENGDESAVFADDVAEDALRLLDAENTRRVVATLPDAQREAVELAYFDSLTYRQVATRTGVPEGTAKSRLRLAMQSLALNLQPN